MMVLAVSLEPTLQRLGEIAALGPDWDSYGGRPPSAQAIATGHRIVFAVYQRLAESAGDRVRPYTIAPMADGGVQLEWTGRGSEIEVDIGPAGTIGYLLIQSVGDARQFAEGDDVPLHAIVDLVSNVLTGGS